jgi:hypothetical protein
LFAFVFDLLIYAPDLGIWNRGVLLSWRRRPNRRRAASQLLQDFPTCFFCQYTVTMDVLLFAGPAHFSWQAIPLPFYLIQLLS